jgi:hypothetical protein
MDALPDKFYAKLLLKEPKFFNRWPLPEMDSYMHAWDFSTVADILEGFTPDKVLLDGSPQYLMVPSAAARVKAAVPHAKFVVVVRVRSVVNCTIANVTMARMTYTCFKTKGTMVNVFCIFHLGAAT